MHEFGLKKCLISSNNGILLLNFGCYFQICVSIEKMFTTTRIKNYILFHLSEMTLDKKMFFLFL